MITWFKFRRVEVIENVSHIVYQIHSMHVTALKIGDFE